MISIKLSLQSLLWEFIPENYFNPKNGDETTEGLALDDNLTQHNCLNEDYFSVFTDVRFYTQRHYEKLIPFLPLEIDLISPPSKGNCFMYALNSKKRINSGFEFEEILSKTHESFDFDEFLLENGDIIVYGKFWGINKEFKPQHAGIYTGDGRVQSKFGNKSPLIEHPIFKVVDGYWNGNRDCLYIARKK